MPLPGYFGFPPFALECFTMYVFVRCLWCRAARSWSRRAVTIGASAAAGCGGRSIGQ
jgi:hypothetical protein